jgi:DNA topoisomerase VI subunit B
VSCRAMVACYLRQRSEELGAVNVVNPHARLVSCIKIPKGRGARARRYVLQTPYPSREALLHCFGVGVLVVAWCTDMMCMHVSARAGAVCGGNMF